MEQILELLKPLVEVYAGKLGIVVQIISIVGTLRLAVKPVMTLIETVVMITPSESDNNLPDEIRASKAYKMVVFVLDWFASIKLPK
jgi:hypothetical protein